MAQDIHITGFVAIIVDAVDIEQTEIESPAVLKESPSIKAMLAARKKESFKAFNSACARWNHEVEYQDHQRLPLGRYEVLFSVRRKSPEEK